MLNEILEYNDYVCNLTPDVVTRLMPEVFRKKNQMHGIGRALTIIARKELADRGYFDTGVEQRKVIVSDVKNALKEWTGFDNENSKHLTEYNSWLKEYYIERIICDDKKETIMPWSEIEKKKKQQYAKSLFSDMKTESNSMNEVTYEGVIADAIYLGPLKKYYLVCKKEYASGLYKNGKQVDSKGKKGAEYIDNILKLISVFLIGKARTGNKTNRVNNAELANWAQNREIFKGEYYKGFTYEGRALIIRNNIAGSCAKISVDDAYLTTYDFHIIGECNVKDVPEGYFCFADEGTGKFLKKF